MCNDGHRPRRLRVVEPNSLSPAGTIAGRPCAVNGQRSMDELRVLLKDRETSVDEDGDSEVPAVGGTGCLDRTRVAEGEIAHVLRQCLVDVSIEVCALGKSPLGIFEPRPAIDAGCSSHLLETENSSTGTSEPADQVVIQRTAPGVQ